MKNILGLLTAISIILFCVCGTGRSEGDLPDFRYLISYEANDWTKMGSCITTLHLPIRGQKDLDYVAGLIENSPAVPPVHSVHVLSFSKFE